MGFGFCLTKRACVGVGIPAQIRQTQTQSESSLIQTEGWVAFGRLLDFC